MGSQVRSADLIRIVPEDNTRSKKVVDFTWTLGKKP